MEITWVRVRGRDQVDTVYPDGTSIVSMRTALDFARTPFRATRSGVASSPTDANSNATAAAVAIIAVPTRTGGVKVVTQSRKRPSTEPRAGSAAEMDDGLAITEGGT